MSQVEISAGQVKELRDRTGAGMMDAKRALQETEGDLDAAQRLLREQGIAAAGKAHATPADFTAPAEEPPEEEPRAEEVAEAPEYEQVAPAEKVEAE